MKKKIICKNEITQTDVESNIITFRDKHVILDSDVARIYGVETRDINKAVKNNPDKFPKDYILQLNKNEKAELVENFHRFQPLKHSTALPKAFPEKGLYMLATILKSDRATKTTILIIETFSKVKEVTKTISQITTVKENTPKHQSLMHRTGELISDLIVPKEIEESESEASIELNLAVVKFKYSVKKKSK